MKITTSRSQNQLSDRELIPRDTGYETGTSVGSQRLSHNPPTSRRYDPATYDPKNRMPWTPEPSSDEDEAYTAWGRKHFGETWWEQRETMLQERNYYSRDKVYLQRQKSLRAMERQIEGRPLRPETELIDEDWKQLWSRISLILPADTHWSSRPTPPHDDDINFNRWKLLEIDRERYDWGEEKYQFEIVFLQEHLIDKARDNRENKEGNRRREDEINAIRELKWSVHPQYENLIRDFNRRCQGWTQKDFDDKREAEERIQRQPPRPPSRHEFLTGKLLTKEQMEQTQAAWQDQLKEWELKMCGASDDTLRAFMNGILTFKDAMSACPAAGILEFQTSESQRVKEAQETINDDGGIEHVIHTRHAKSTQEGRTTRTRLSPSILGRWSRKRPKKAVSLTPENLGTETKDRSRKVYKNVRASRRLANKPPEYGMLAENKIATPIPEVSKHQQQKTHQSDAPALHKHASVKRKSTAVKGTKPQGISKTKTQASTRSTRNKKYTG